ncbi:MAG: hypothetical protein M0Z27_07720 [Thermaerobacter sp.]|nr:hypothetical protein [Thermaerobacter sp.]
MSASEGDPAVSLAALSERQQRLAEALATAAQQTAAGRLPAADLAEELAAVRREFAALREALLAAARDLGVGPLPDPATLTDVSSLTGLQRAVAERDRRRQLVRRAARVLQQAQSLSHRDDRLFQPLAEAKNLARSLGERLDGDPELAGALVEGRHPLAQLLLLVEQNAALDDARWHQLQDAVRQAFGTPLALAAARGKLRASMPAAAPAPAPALPAPVAPEPPGALLWHLVGLGRADLAYHLSDRLARQDPEHAPEPPPWLLRALTLAPHLTERDGPIAALLAQDFRRRDPAWPGEDALGLQLLLVAAALRPAILSPRCGAGAVLAGLPRHSQLPGLRELCGTLAAEPPREDLFEASGGEDPTALRQEASGWLEQLPLGITIFPSATRVWRRWLAAEGCLRRLLEPVAADDASRRELITAELARLDNEAELTREVDAVDPGILGRMGSDPLNERILNQLILHGRQVLALADRWARLTPSAAAGSVHRLAKLTAEARAELPAVLRRLAPSPALRAGAAECARSLEQAENLLTERVRPPGDEPDPGDVLAQALAALADHSPADLPPQEPPAAAFAQQIRHFLAAQPSPPAGL